MLTTAESLLGLSRHLAEYALGPDRAALGNLEFAGHVLEIAVRLRGSGVSTANRVAAISLDAGIPLRSLELQVLPALEMLGWLDFERDSDRSLQIVSEQIPPLPELVSRANKVLDIANPELVERALLKILDATTAMPLTRETAIEIGIEVADEPIATRAIDYLQALQLAQVGQSADGAEVVYNPNIWSFDVQLAEAALRAGDPTVRSALSGLIEEVGATPGLPQNQVTSADRQWINYAVAKGLVQRSLVVTSSGEERAFLFTPHMNKNAFSDSSGVDPSGHVRQLIGSMMYAKNYGQTRLNWPGAFVRKLIQDGEAGDASAIGTDYPMLETAGIVRVEPTGRFFKLVLLQSDVAEQALSYLTVAADSSDRSLMKSALRDQRKYVPPEGERAKLGRQADTRPAETERLIAALRQEAGRRRFSGED